MAKVAMSAESVMGLVCEGVKSRYYDIDCAGLMLEVRSSGRATFYFVFTHNSKTKMIWLGAREVVGYHYVVAKAKELRQRLALGEDILKSRQKKLPRLRELFYDRYLPYVKHRKKSSRTDEVIFRNQIAPILGGVRVNELTKEMVEDYITIKLKSYSQGYINRSLMILKYIYNLCVDVWEILDSSVMRKIKLLPDLNGAKERFLTYEEVERLLQELEKSKSKHLKSIVIFALLTGARKREILDARWGDFDFENRLWRIRESKSGVPRYVPISDDLVQLLEQVPRECEYLFASPKTKKPYTAIQAPWERVRNAAGLEGLRIHDLRHSFASFLVNGGRSLYEVQRLLGHSHIKTTMRYSHLSQDTLLEAVNSIGIG